jgi:hypothetical protein
VSSGRPQQRIQPQGGATITSRNAEALTLFLADSIIAGGVRMRRRSSAKSAEQSMNIQIKKINCKLASLQVLMHFV